jgi:hypothetical protein
MIVHVYFMVYDSFEKLPAQAPGLNIVALSTISTPGNAG